MNKEIKKHLMAFNMKRSWRIQDKGLVDTLKECGKIVHEKKMNTKNRWDTWFVVKDIDGMLIGYEDCRSMRYGCVTTKSTICRVKLKRKLFDVYERVIEDE